MKRKGVAFAIVVIAIGIFTFGIGYIIFNTVLIDNLIPIMENQTSSSDALDNINAYETLWNLLPFYVIGVFLIFGIVQALRREPTSRITGI